ARREKKETKKETWNELRYVLDAYSRFRRSGPAWPYVCRTAHVFRALRPRRAADGQRPRGWSAHACGRRGIPTAGNRGSVLNAGRGSRGDRSPEPRRYLGDARRRGLPAHVRAMAATARTMVQTPQQLTPETSR